MHLPAAEPHVCMPCRALGEYAASSRAASDQEAKRLVDQAFLTLQNYDFELFQAIRMQQPVPEAAVARLQSAVAALDSLLATVPGPVYTQAQVNACSTLRGSRADLMRTGGFSSVGQHAICNALPQDVVRTIEEGGRAGGSAEQRVNVELFQQLVPASS